MERPETPEAAQAHIAQIRKNKGFDARTGAQTCNVDDLEAALDILSAELYQQSTHFLFELIQNADDCSYVNCTSNDEDPTIDITYWNNRLRVDYNEDGFTKRDVEALCRIKKSTKLTTESQIGEKGIGFKSVFRMANVVWVHSYNYSFQFDKSRKLGMITPAWVDDAMVRRDNFTSILLQVPNEDDQKELVREMKSLTPKCLMFLRNIRRINIRIDAEGGEGYRTRLVRDDGLPKDRSPRYTRLRRDDQTLSYHVFRHNVHGLPPEPRRMNNTEATIELAFPTFIDHDEPVIESQQVYAFLPIRDYGFKFLVNADFLLTANRQDIAKPSGWNEALVECIEDAFINAVKLLNTSTMRYKWPRYLPIPLAFSNVFSDLRMEKLGQSPVLEAEDKGWITPLSARYVPISLRDDSNRPLISSPKAQSRNLSREYKDSDWEYFKNIGVQQLSYSEFLEDVREFYANNDFTSSHSDRWHSQLAGVLEPLLYDFRSVLENIPLVPLADGRWVSISAGPILFPDEKHTIPEGVNLLQLRHGVNEDPRWASFLKGLGVQPFKPHDVQERVSKTHFENDLSQVSCSILISHAVFLFRLRSSYFYITKEFWVATKVGPPRHVRDVYLDAPWPHSASQYLDRNSDDVHFLHGDYFDAVQPAEKNHWLIWLHEELGIWHIPRLDDIVKSLRRLSADPKNATGTQLSREVLVLLRDNWRIYRPHAWSMLIQEFSSARVSCLDGKPWQLRDTHTVSLIPDIWGPEIQSLQPILDIPELDSPGWTFLEKFGVTVRDSIDFYLSTLKKVQGTEVPDGFISWLYDNIQSRTHKDNLDSVREVFKEKSIYIPSPGAGIDPTWVQESECVWNATDYLRKFHVLKKIYPGNAQLFKNILRHTHANFEVLVSEVEEITASNPASWITQIFKEINRILCAKKYEAEELHHLDSLVSMKVFPTKKGDAGTGFEKLCSGTTEAEWYIADRPHLQQSFDGVVYLLAFTIEDILEILPLITALKLESRLLSRMAVPSLQTEGDVQLHAGYTTIFRQKSRFILCMLPKYTSHRAELRNALENIKVSTADRIRVRWTIEINSNPEISEIRSGRTDDGLKGVVLPPSENKEIEVYLQNGRDSDIPVEVAEQLASICGIDRRSMLVYYVLNNSDDSSISNLLARNGLIVPMETMSGSDEVEPTDADEPSSDVASEHSDSSSVPKIPQAPKLSKEKEIEEADTRPDSHEWIDTGDRISTDETRLQPRTTTTSVSASESPSPEAPPSELPPDSLPTGEKAPDESAFPSSKVDANPQLHLQPPVEPLLPRLSHIWLRDTPETFSAAPRKGGDIVESTSAKRELANSGPPTMFNRPRIVGPPSVVFVSRPQDLPRENFSGRASGDKTLPARARISQSGASTIFVAANPDIGDDIDATFLSELFVSQLLKKYLGDSYDADTHWTSHFRTRAYYSALRDDTDATTTFTLENVPDMTELLIESSFKEARKWRRQTPVFYIQAHDTRGTHDMSFLLSHENFERIRRCNTLDLPRSIPEEVFILVLVSNESDGARASWFVDPWRMYASGQLVIRPDKYHYVAQIRSPEPVLVSRDFGSEAPKNASPKSHGSLRDLFRNLEEKGNQSRLILNDKPYVYQPLPLGNSQTIRILELYKGHDREELKGALRNVPLDSINEQFEAISYVWGRDLKPFILKTSRGNIGLTTSLYFGLQRLRQKKASVLLWADAICIDQGNNGEKSHQIRLMAEIYRSARKVCIWLGNEAENSAQAMRCLRAIGKHPGQSPAPTVASEEDWDSINRFFGRPWFHRVWIVQELVLARKATVFCGMQKADWDEVYKAVRICSENAKKSTAAIMTHIAQQADVILSLGELRQSYHEGSGQRDLLTLFERFQHTRATQQRDKLFAFLGLALDARDPGFDPDYDATFDDIVRRYGRTFVKRGCALKLLYRAGYSSSRFPSWVPDWVTNVQRQTITTWPSKMGHFSAFKHKEIDIVLSREDGDVVLVARGCVFDTIERVGQISSDRTLYLKEIFQAIKSLDSYPTGDSLEDLVWKVPIGDAEKPISGTWEEINFRRSCEAFIEFLQSGEKLTDWETEVKEMSAMYRVKQFLFRPQELRKSMWPFLHTAFDFAARFTNAKVCVTKGGFIGIVPGTAKAGDTIALFHGSAVPFLLRRRKTVENRYVHLGEGYIHGIMHGELRSRRDLRERKFRLS